jgi:hypothetical protein
MGKAFRASLLVLLLACSAQAGYMPNGSPDPTPPLASAEQEPSLDGNIPNDAPNSLTELTLDLLAVLPSLL